MPRRRRAALAVAAVAVAGLAGTSTAGAVGSDPAHNIAATPRIAGSICDRAPTSSDCRTRLAQALDHGRDATGLANYVLPDRFGSLTPREKLLVLTNQDRLAHGLAPVYGLNYWLNQSAQNAVAVRADPQPVSTLGGAHWSLWTANWAGGNGASENPMYAHYHWMYYDGLNADGTSWNYLCSPADQTLCWKHRHNILVGTAPDSQLALGVGAGPDGQGWYGFTQLFEAFPASAPIAYVPTVVRVSSRVASRSGGKVITIGGFGFVGVTSVTVVGKRATVLARDPWHLTVRVPANAPRSGYIVVTTQGGTSTRNYAAGFHYV